MYAPSFGEVFSPLILIVIYVQHLFGDKKMLNSKPYRGLLGLGAEEGHGKL